MITNAQSFAKYFGNVAEDVIVNVAKSVKILYFLTTKLQIHSWNVSDVLLDISAPRNNFQSFNQVCNTLIAAKTKLIYKPNHT